MIPRRTVAAMAVGCGLAVANLYYAQPLLASLGKAFGASDRSMGLAATLSQVGYALGMLGLVPLGDRVERRGLILGMLGASALALLGMGLAPSYPAFAVASLLVGITTITPQLLVPFAASLAAPEERGKVVGTVMSGLLIGILLARTASGLVDAWLGWRAVFLLASALMLALAGALRFALPRSVPEPTGLTYLGLLRSLIGLVREERVLRESCLFGAAMFAAFSILWTDLAFHLAKPPFAFGPGMIGLFGLIGVVGALAAPLAGRLADAGSPRRTIGLGFAVVLASYAVFYLGGGTVAGLGVGVIGLDLGAQAGHISNQSRIFAVRPEARSRMNTVYMVSSFTGAASGAALGSLAWGRIGWPGVCLAGAGVAALGLLAFALTARRGSRPA